MSGLMDVAQAASNAVAGNVSGPVDMLAFLLRKAGVPVPEDPVLGTEWLKKRGLIRDVPQGAAQVAGETLGLLAPVAVAAKASQIASGLLRAQENAAAPRTLRPDAGAIVWHGSPHKFDRFDSSKIGTGEGAQAYGHGLYLAENPGVATGYADKLSQVSINGGWTKTPRIATYGLRRVDTTAPSSSLSPGELALTYANIEGGKANGILALREMANDPYIKDAGRYRKAADILMRLDPKKIGAEYGNLYKVDLPDDKIARMLDWDKPLSQQPIGSRMSVVKNESPAFSDEKWLVNIGDTTVNAYKTKREAAAALESATGQDLWKALNASGARVGADGLRQQGIPGIRYLDGGSRGAGSGTSNFVVFPGEEGLLTILERNGVPLGR